MPIYEYMCDRCGHEFERLQHISDPPVTTCPECRKHAVRRLISKTSFILKGTGWYVTDYARKPAAGSKGTDAKTSAQRTEPEAKPKSKSPTEKTSDSTMATSPAS